VKKLRKTDCSSLGQAKLIISFPFQGFQNGMWEGSHFSLFFMTEILRKQFKKLINTAMKILQICGNCHIIKILWHLQRSMWHGQKQESNCLGLI